MQQLTIRTATHLSAQDLYSALAVEFHPELSTDDEGRCYVSVELGSDRHVLEVLATIQEFIDARAAGTIESSVVFSLDDRRYTMRPRNRQRGSFLLGTDTS